MDAIERMACKAEVACLTSECKLEFLQMVVVGIGGVGGGRGMSSEGVGDLDAVLNEIGRLGRASRQFGESERFRMGWGASRWGGLSRQLGYAGRVWSGWFGCL